MTCLSGISGWAGDMLTSVGETGIATGQVVNWITHNLGKLNIAIEGAWWVSGVSGCIQPNLGQAESGIYTEMWLCHYFTRKASENLGAMAYDSWTEIQGEDQGSIRRVSKNETAKTYRSLAKDCKENIQQLVKWYKDHTNGYEPLQVTYNQRVGSADSALREPWEIYPPASVHSPFNVVWN